MRRQDLAKRVMDEGKPTYLPAISLDRAVDRAALAAQCGFDDAIGFPIVGGGQSAAVMLFFAESIGQPDEQLFVCLTAIAEQVGQLLKRLQTEEALRATEDSLLQAHKMEAMGRLVGGVVHDFNNLLTVILGYSELLLESTKIAIPSRDAIVEVRNAARHAANLTKRILSFCRKKTYCPVVLNLNTSVEEMEPMIRSLIGKEIDLRVALAPDLHHVRADPAQIEQVLMNLIINARDAIGGRGRLTLETKNVNLQRNDLGGISGGFAGPYVVLSISDTGTGMDEATQRRIFEPFYTTKPSGRGTGLGLATVRDIMTQCGGDILVDSKPGEGTTFRLVYPRAPKGLSPWQVHSALRRFRWVRKPSSSSTMK